MAKIRIGSFDYEFSLRPFGIESDRDGVSELAKLKIAVDSNLPSQQLFDVFIHETLHCLNDQLKLWDEPGNCSKFTRVLATPLSRFIKDNLKLINELAK